jgi:hypothetical protein
MARRPAWLPPILALCALVALAACTSQAKLREAELSALAAQLPGQYDNLTQVQAETASGRPGVHAAQSLTILRVHAPLVGDQVFFVRETAARDARRVIAQRIWSLEVLDDARIVAGVYLLDEPDRWVDGGANPELFTSLLLRDLRALPGCQLVWQKTALGFSGDTLPAGCRRPGGEDGARVSQHWRLAGEVLDFGEAASGAPEAPADSYYRFERRDGAP